MNTSIEQGVAQTLYRLVELNGAEVVEVRIPGVGAGYFDRAHIPAAAFQVARIDAKVKPTAFYVTLNPVSRTCLDRAPNSIVPGLTDCTKDSDITCRRLLLVDADPVRTSKTSSTDSEKTAALERLRECCAWLSEQGWPAPVLGDSGNGGHALYPIDLPNDEASTRLVSRVLKILDQKFSDAFVKIDTTVNNASRITKLYGTMTRKGIECAERPYRVSRLEVQE
jgi:hypothetical protein